MVAPLANRTVLMAGAVPLAIKPQSNPVVRAEPILSAPPGTWAESDLESLARPVFDPLADRLAPLVVGVAASDAPRARGDDPTPKLVVLSCPSVADDYYVRNEPNLDLVVNAVQWLRDRPDLQGLSPRRREVLAFRADPDLRARLVALPTLVSLGVIVAAAVATYMARGS